MTRCRPLLEKKILTLQEAAKVQALKVANRLLGIRRYAYLRPVPPNSPKYVDGWKIVKTFDSKEDAHRHAASQRVQYWLVEEIFE